LEDLFREPATQPAAPDGAAAGDPLQDLIGDRPAEALAPSQPQPDASSDPPAELLQDLFGDQGAAPAAPSAEQPPATPADPQGQETTDELFKDLFGNPDAEAGDAADAADPFGATQPAVDPLAQRQWVDDTGSFTVNARLIAILDGKVRLLKENGRTCTVRLDRLSPPDLALVEQTRARYGSGMIAHFAGRR
jgi:hypothetical protein